MSKKYFARIGGKECGPYELDRLAEVGVTPDTYIWCKGMADWTRARHDAEVCRMFRQRLFDMAHPSLASSGDEVEPSKSAPDNNAETAPSGSVNPRYPWVGDNETAEPKPDYSVPPRSRVTESILVTLFCSLLGVVAIFYSFAAQRAWREGNAEKAYDYTRLAKMWIGIAFFIGIIGAAFMMRMFM